jgi:hypothetical protein
MLARGLVLAAAICAGIAAMASPARADDNVAKADKLFDEGRALMASDLHAACEKFEESLKWNSQAIGTLMNVALCDEKLGRVASAYARFAEARDRAREGNMEVHLKAAEEQLAALEARVPHVHVSFATPPLPETQVVIDDQVIADVKAKFPIDPGVHTLAVSAPNRVPFQTKVQVAEGETREVSVPELAKPTTVSSKKTLGKVFVVAGGATMAAGWGVLATLVARHRYNAQFPSHCNETTRECDSTGQSAVESARTLGTVGTVVGFVGLAAAGVGAYLWLRAPKEGSDTAADRGVTLVPQVDPAGSGAVGVAAVGRF